MGLFTVPNKEEMEQKKMQKEQEKIDKFMKKYNLDSIDKEDLEILNRISRDLAGNGFFKTGMALSFAKAEEQAKVTYLSALVEQNWMIIKLLSKINDNLKK